MKPENVNPRNFKVKKIIYDKEGFSIAIGTWQDDESERFAMRWNGKGEKDKGYPSVLGHPMWFQLSEDVKGIITTILKHCDIKIR